MMKNTLVFIFILFSSVAQSFADEAPRQPQRVPTLTRLVTLFGGLENQWLDAVQDKDADTVKSLLADDYEIRIGSSAGEPTPRNEAMELAMQAPAFTSSLSQIAAHDYGNIVVVSFVWRLDVAGSNTLAQNIFVVDTWRQIEGKWRVQARYAAPIDDPGKTVPGAAVKMANGKKA
jgi:hypothetical protein